MANPKTRALDQEDAIIARFSQIDTSLVTDAFLRLGLSGWMDDVLPITPGLRIAARARTLAFRPVRHDGQAKDSMYSVIARVNPGEVLVMGSGGTHDNLMGDNMATFARRSGLAGVVTDSRTRDRAGIRSLNLPMFSRGGAVRPPIEVEPHEFDAVIACGGAQVRPGDVIVADDDGVVVVPADRAEDVLYQIDDIVNIETRMSNTIRAGGSVAEIEALAKMKKILRS